MLAGGAVVVPRAVPGFSWLLWCRGCGGVRASIIGRERAAGMVFSARKPPPLAAMVARDENGRKQSAKDSTIFAFTFFLSETKAVRCFRKRKRRRYSGNFENGNIRSRTH